MVLTVKDSLNLGFMVISTVAIIWGVMVWAGEHDTSKTHFERHPLFMAIGWSLCLTMGFWMFNYEDLPGSNIDTREGRRKAHAFCQLMGSTFIFCGYYAVVHAHSASDQ